MNQLFQKIDNEILNKTQSNSKIKGPMNPLILSSIKGRKELPVQNPTITTTDINSIIGNEWENMGSVCFFSLYFFYFKYKKSLNIFINLYFFLILKNLNINYINEAKSLKDNFDNKNQDYVYTCSSNNTRKRKNIDDAYDNEINTNVNYQTNSSMSYPNNLYSYQAMQYMNPSISIKQPPNAFIIFNRIVRPSVRKENPDLSVAEISKIISKKWKTLSDDEKKLYYDESKRLRNEYNFIKKLKKGEPNDNSDTISLSLSINESKFSPYPSPENSPKNTNNFLGFPFSMPKRRLRTPKHPSQPKHPSSAFLFYLRDERPKYAAKYPTKSLGFISKLISKEWKELSDVDRAKYIKKSEEDKKRYTIEKQIWMEKMSKKEKGTD